MGIWTLYSLREWHLIQQQNLRKSPEPHKITVFGSFLDKDSMEIAYKLIRKPSLASYHDNQMIDLVFFPISRIQEGNSFIFEMLENFFLNPHLIDLNSNIFEIIVQASRHQKRAREIANHEQHSPEQRNFSLFGPRISPESQLFVRNKAQYGTLAALYLKSITQFPTIYIGGRVYNGIPLNFSVDQFLETIIQGEISILLQNLASYAFVP